MRQFCVRKGQIFFSRCFIACIASVMIVTHQKAEMPQKSAVWGYQPLQASLIIGKFSFCGKNQSKVLSITPMPEERTTLIRIAIGFLSAMEKITSQVVKCSKSICHSLLFTGKANWQYRVLLIYPPRYTPHFNLLRFLRHYYVHAGTCRLQKLYFPYQKNYNVRNSQLIGDCHRNLVL